MKFLQILSVILVSFSFIICDGILNAFKKYENNSVSNSFQQSYLMAKYSLKSALDCVLYCNINDQCLSVVFNKSVNQPFANCFWYNHSTSLVAESIILSISTDFYKKNCKCFSYL